MRSMKGFCNNAMLKNKKESTCPETTSCSRLEFPTVYRNACNWDHNIPTPFFDPQLRIQSSYTDAVQPMTKENHKEANLLPMSASSRPKRLDFSVEVEGNENLNNGSITSPGVKFPQPGATKAHSPLTGSADF